MARFSMIFPAINLHHKRLSIAMLRNQMIYALIVDINRLVSKQLDQLIVSYAAWVPVLYLAEPFVWFLDTMLTFRKNAGCLSF